MRRIGASVFDTTERDGLQVGRIARLGVHARLPGIQMKSGSMDAERPVVVLFREASEEDPYVAALAASGYTVRSIPVLRFEFINRDALRRALNSPRRYSGLVLTSPRAVEALARTWEPARDVAWRGKSVLAVGPRTAADVRALGIEAQGEESGNAESLAEVLTRRAFDRPLLFLSGDRRRDVLPRRLRAAGVPFQELCIYRTHVRSDLQSHAWKGADWVVFFSPSGIEGVFASGKFDDGSIRIAAIGSTTASALRARGVRVDAVARRPAPDALLAAIRAAETEASPSRRSSRGH